ncbi:MAG: hypothetical protein NC188_00050 [Corallococcus sp.]|nr:hypothetical protein [Corallococcus sp.]
MLDIVLYKARFISIVAHNFSKAKTFAAPLSHTQQALWISETKMWRQSADEQMPIYANSPKTIITLAKKGASVKYVKKCNQARTNCALDTL